MKGNAYIKRKMEVLFKTIAKQDKSWVNHHHHLPDPLSPPVSNIHRSQEVFEATSCISTELFYIGSSWSSCLCSSMWRGPQEYIAVYRMSGSSNFDNFRDGCIAVYCRTAAVLWGVASRTWLTLLTGFLSNCRQAFSPYVYFAPM